VRHVLVRDSGQAISGLNTRLSRVDWVISLVSTTTVQRELTVRRGRVAPSAL
jgi:hypothetical protein